MSDDDRRDGTTVERDHPQTRKGESDARGSAEWNEDVVKPEADEERSARDAAAATAGATEEGAEQPQLDEGDQEAIRRHAHGGRSMGDAIGSGAGVGARSGTGGDTGDVGGGGQGAGNHPGGTATPGGSGR